MRHTLTSGLLAALLLGSLLGCQRTESEPSTPLSPSPAPTQAAAEPLPVSEIIHAMLERTNTLKQVNPYQRRSFDLQAELLPHERLSITTYHANGFTFFDVEVMDPTDTFDFWVRNGDEQGKSLYLSFFDGNGHDQAIVEASFQRFVYEEGARHGYSHLYGYFKQSPQAYQALDSVAFSISTRTSRLNDRLDVAGLGGLAKVLTLK